MQNREKATRLIRIVTKEYGNEIIAKGSKVVMSLEDHIDRIIEEILEVESDIVIVAREQRKVIERAAMTERIDKVKIILGQVDNHTTAKSDEIKSQKSKLDIEIVQQSDTSNINSNIASLEIEFEENQLPIDGKVKEESSQIEEVQEIKEEKDNSITNLY